MAVDAARLEELAQAFEIFSEYDAAGTSPLYERLAMAVSADEQLLGLAAEARFAPIPNLFFAAVHLRLFEVPDDPLARYYRSLSGEATLAPDGDELPGLLRAFCMRERGALVETLHRRRVQTNEPRRSIYLLLLLAAVQRLHPDRPLALVEVGSSAGLNLQFDRYAYDLAGQKLGPAGSEVTLKCEIVGPPPPMPTEIPRLADRAGIDLHPLDVGDESDVAWLRALTWPDHGERRRVLDKAITIAQEEPPEVMEGDALDLLPAVIHGMPRDAWTCVFDSFSLSHFDGSQRARFASILQELAHQRPIAWISAEANGVVMAAPRRPSDGPHQRGSFFGVLGLIHFGPRGSVELPLGYGDGHARWVEWLNPDV